MKNKATKPMPMGSMQAFPLGRWSPALLEQSRQPEGRQHLSAPPRSYLTSRSAKDAALNFPTSRSH